MFQKNLGKKRNKVKEFLKKNPNATYKDIKHKLRIKIERIYKKGMGEAFKDAGVIPPRNFQRKSKDEKRKIIIDYIRNHPKTGGHTMRKDTKIDFLTIFKNTKEAFDAAGVEYPREVDKRNRNEKKKLILNLIKEDPLITINEILNQTQTNPYNFFKGIEEMYKEAGIKKISGPVKRTTKKRLEIIKFIKENPFATQREINIRCKTHVQEIFFEGIFEAYRNAGVEYPYKRLNVHGVVIKNIKFRAKKFENRIATKLKKYGAVNQLVKTKRGFADIVLERKGQKAIIEVKDYRAKHISISQVKQLNKYLEDCNCKIGILVSHQKPKKDKFLIGDNKIFIIGEFELSKIPELMGS